MPLTRHAVLASATVRDRRLREGMILYVRVLVPQRIYTRVVDWPNALDLSVHAGSVLHVNTTTTTTRSLACKYGVHSGCGSATTQCACACHTN